MITRTIQGVTFEFDTPSVFRPLGLPVEIRYEDGAWTVELLWKHEKVRGQYPTREAAIAIIARGLAR